MLRFHPPEDLAWTALRWDGIKAAGLDPTFFRSQENFQATKEAQAGVASLRYQTVLDRDPGQINPSAETIQGIHQEACGVLYRDRAGKFRTAEESLWFRPAALPDTIQDELARLHRDFDAEFHWATNQAENRNGHVAEAIGRYHVRLLQIHPFETGNGTVARVILSHQVAHFMEGGPSLGKWTPIDRMDYAYAIARGERYGDFKPFQAVLDNALHNREVPWKHEAEHPGVKEYQDYCQDRNIKIVYEQSAKKDHSNEHNH